MHPRPLATASLTTAVLLSAVLPSTARATGTVTVAPHKCGQVSVANRTAGTVSVRLDDDATVPQATPTGLAVVPVDASGTHHWFATDLASGRVVASGAVTVPPCTGLPARPVPGDEDGDGHADVLGVTTTGDLYRYRSTARGLAEGVKVGVGWGRMVHVQRVTAHPRSGWSRQVVAFRDDGHIWRYAETGAGRLSDGVHLGSGTLGATSIAVSEPANPASPGRTDLWIVRDGRLLRTALIAGDEHDWQVMATVPAGTAVRCLPDFDGDGWYDVVTTRPDGTMWVQTLTPLGSEDRAGLTSPRRIGQGWGGMGTVTSPGSVDGDGLSDLLARHRNGDLYLYRNLGGRLAEGERIGQRWNGIRLLA